MPKDSNHEEILAHFPQIISQGLVDFARDTVFARSRYFFVRREGKYQFGYCTHCQQEYVCGWYGSCVLKHNEPWRCHSCGTECTVKSSGLGRKHLYDDAYFVYYEKSVIDPAAIVARGIYVIRDYSGDYTKVETKYRMTALYLFKPGQSVMLHRYWWQEKGAWIRRKSVGSEFYTSMKYKSCFVSRPSIETAVQGMQFQYSTWERYGHESPDFTRFFAEAARYPCIEYLTKMGLRSLVVAKLHGGAPTRGIVNWRGKTIFKVLHMSKMELRDLRTANVTVDVETLQAYQYFKRIGIPVSVREAHFLKNLPDGYYLKELKQLLDYASLERIVRYLLKQHRRPDTPTQFMHGGSVLLDWRDYLNDCKELGMDVNKEHVLFPNNLYAAHQKTIEKVKVKRDESLNILIAERLKSLKKYGFEFNGLFVRPARDSIELFNEGKALNHCVGRYADRYAEGHTSLFFIRKVDEPDTPFYTMEVIDNRITQVRGKNNSAPDEEVSAFTQKFVAARLTPRQKRHKLADAAQTA